MTIIINGKTIAQDLKEDIKKRLIGKRPGLAVILVGNHLPSLIYVANKQKACEEVGIESYLIRLDETITQQELHKHITTLNDDPKIHSILLQLPLPSHLNAFKALEKINPKKDVDGLHPHNLGLLLHNKGRLIPCTPLGCLKLIQSVESSLKGLHCVVLGRSILVGKPMSLLLTQHDATVTLAHSHTKHLKDICKQADILVVAIGKPAFITKDFVNPNAIVIDVGINRVDEKIVGDVDFKDVSPSVKAITPVPGGVGPMTIACLLWNTYQTCL